ncbi:MAG: RNA degradosome polyphosphate kinase, partial [Clostridiaceae bacterium]|nr:RNA degradosome polyphosphate kinase [Clostridiaceae bacterium]
MAKGDKENGKQKNDAKTLAIASYDRFINRELSWLDFNERVLQEARDSETPLLERLSFLAISQSNLDEFIMVRIASLKDQIKARDFTREVSGLTAADQLEKISERMHKFAQKQYNTYNRQLLPRLEKEGIFILPRHRLVSEQISFAHSYFRTTLYPILTPMAVDQGRPFPLIPNRSQNIAVLLERDDEEDNELHFATVQIPSGLPRLVKLPVEQFSKVNGLEERGTHCYILLEELINAYLGEVFHGLRIMARCMYRIIRNAVMDFDEEDTPDLLTEIEKQLRQRQWGEVINLSVREDVSPKLLNTLIELTHVAEEDIYHLSGPLDLTFMGKLSRAAELRYRKDLLYPA